MQPLMDIENKFAMFVMPTEREQAVLTRLPTLNVHLETKTYEYKME